MGIRRKVRRETVSKTRTFAILHNSINIESRVCDRCEGSQPMLEPDRVREIYELSEREIFRHIEDGQVHFVEANNKRIFVCLLTLGEALGGETKLLIEEKK